MTNQSDALAQIYALILSDQWGFNNLAKNQNASPDAAKHQGWSLTDGVEKPHSSQIITDDKLGE